MIIIAMFEIATTFSSFNELTSEQIVLGNMHRVKKNNLSFSQIILMYTNSIFFCLYSDGYWKEKIVFLIRLVYLVLMNRSTMQLTIIFMFPLL